MAGSLERSAELLGKQVLEEQEEPGRQKLGEGIF
jgi:hypothetical protein